MPTANIAQGQAQPSFAANYSAAISAYNAGILASTALARTGASVAVSNTVSGSNLVSGSSLHYGLMSNGVSSNGMQTFPTIMSTNYSINTQNGGSIIPSMNSVVSVVGLPPSATTHTTIGPHTATANGTWTGTGTASLTGSGSGSGSGSSPFNTATSFSATSVLTSVGQTNGTGTGPLTTTNTATATGAGSGTAIFTATAPITPVKRPTISDYAVWGAKEDALVILAAQEIGWPVGERRVSQWEELFKSYRGKNDLPYHYTVLSGRIYVRRLKEITNILRVSPVEAVKVIETVAPQIQKIKQKIAPKLNTFVLKTIMKYGYPRKIYEELSVILNREKAEIDMINVDKNKEKEVDKSSYLLMWPAFATLCSVRDDKSEGEIETPCTVQEVQEIVYAMINVKSNNGTNGTHGKDGKDGKESNNGNNSIGNTIKNGKDLKELKDGKDGKDGLEVTVESEGGGEAVTEGLLAGLNIRVIDVWIKSDIMHRLRMTLACHSDAELISCFKVMKLYVVLVVCV